LQVPPAETVRQSPSSYPREDTLVDSQAIYSFRAATIRNIMRFAKQFRPKARIIKLEQNYRSTQQILDACAACFWRTTLAAPARTTSGSNAVAFSRPRYFHSLSAATSRRSPNDNFGKLTEIPGAVLSFNKNRSCPFKRLHSAGF